MSSPYTKARKSGSLNGSASRSEYATSQPHLQNGPESNSRWSNSRHLSSNWPSASAKLGSLRSKDSACCGMPYRPNGPNQCLFCCGASFAVAICGVLIAALIVAIVLLMVRMEATRTELTNLMDKTTHLEDRLRRDMARCAPSKEIAFFFDDKCPDGWVFEPQAVGRVLVGSNQTARARAL